MKVPENRQIARLIHRVLSNMGDEQVIAEVRKDVRTLCARFPGP